MEQFNFLADLYKDIFFWISRITPGEHTCISRFKKYDKKVWIKIKNKIVDLENKNSLTTDEKEFLKCKYVGKAYRVITYNSRNRGHVYIVNNYQSFSKNIQAVKNVKVYGNKILIEINANKYSYAIDIFELLQFMIKKEIIRLEDFKKYNFLELEEYKCEKEVVVPLIEENVININIVNFEENKKIDLSKSKWYRNGLY
jgi:hypothetical protein